MCEHIKYYSVENEGTDEYYMIRGAQEAYRFDFSLGKMVRCPSVKEEQTTLSSYKEYDTEEAFYKAITNSKILYEKMCVKAYELALASHEGMLDKGGHQYIDHPIFIATNFGPSDEKIVAFLHDIIEDTKITADNLLAMGFSIRVINALVAISRGKTEHYMEYIERLSHNSIAKRVKLFDLQHNMDLSRIANPRELDFKRVEKYKKAYEFLLRGEANQ